MVLAGLMRRLQAPIGSRQTQSFAESKGTHLDLLSLDAKICDIAKIRMMANEKMHPRGIWV